MTVLGEVVLQTQQIEEQFEKDASYLLEQLAYTDPVRDDSSLARLYARSVLNLGDNCSEMVSAAIAHRESGK